MSTKFVPFVLLAVLAAPTAAQQGQEKKAKPIPAAGKAAVMTEFSLPVTGLTEELGTAVERELADLTVQRYECPGCGHSEARPGECKGCEAQLEPVSVKVFEDVGADAEKSMISLHLTKGVEARLGQIEKALGASNVQVQREKIALRPGTVLVFRGATSKDDANALLKAMKKAKLSDDVVDLDPETNEVRVRVHGANATWAGLAALGSGLENPLRLEDAIFGMKPGKGIKAS